MTVTIHYVGFHPTLILDGFERVRLAEPIERVYLLYDGKQDRYGAVSKLNVKRLSQVLSFFKPILVPVNPLSYSSVFSKVYAILEAEAGAGRRVLVDITDMPPMMAAAVTAAAMMFKGVKLYCVHPDQRGEFIPDPDTPEFEDWVQRKDSKRALKVAPLELPGERRKLLADDEEELYAILEALYERNGSADSIKSLIRWCGRDPRDPVVKAQFSRMVAELEDRGLVRRIHRGKARSVILTELGRALVEAKLREPELLKRVREVELKPLLLSSPL